MYITVNKLNNKSALNAYRKNSQKSKINEKASDGTALDGTYLITELRGN